MVVVVCGGGGLVVVVVWGLVFVVVVVVLLDLTVSIIVFGLKVDSSATFDNLIFCYLKILFPREIQLLL